MRFLKLLRHRLRSLFLRNHVEDELKREFAFHLAEQIRENIAAGMEPAEARTSALRTMGSIAQHQEQCRDMRRVNYVEDFVADLRFAARGLRRTPVFTAVAILTLALGIGASTALYSLARTIFFQPLPIGDFDRLVVVWSDMTAFGFPEGNPSPADYEDWRRRNQVFTGIGAASVESFALTGDGQPEQLAGLRTTPNFLDLFQLTPAAGTLTTASSDGNVVILSDGLWRRRFGGDSKVIGRTIRLNGDSYTVAGIAPPGFEFPGRGTDVWIPRDFTPAEKSLRTARVLVTVARIKPGLTLQQARAGMTTLSASMAAEYPEDKDIGVRLVSMREYYSKPAESALDLLAGAVVLMLLIACSNLAHLLLSRGTTRSREIALRTALGATRTRVVRQLLSESTLLALVGAAFGVVLAAAAFPFLASLIPYAFAVGTRPSLDLSALVFTAFVAVVCGVFFGVGPALHASKLELNDALRQGVGCTDIRTGKLRHLLVGAEITITLVLLAGAGLLLQSYLHLRFVETGFNPSHLVIADTSLPTDKYSEFATRKAFVDQTLLRAGALPGVTSAGYVNLAPLTMRGGMAGFVIEGRPAPAAGEIYEINANIRSVSPGYLQALGVPLLRGRMLSETDSRNSPRVFVINETMARTFWPGEDPLGKRIQFPFPGTVQPWYTVVGVVKDIKQMGLDVPSYREMYFTFDQVPIPPRLLWPRYLVVRTTLDTATIAPLLRNAVREVDPGQPIASIETMDDILDREVTARRTNATLILVFACIALTLSAIGLYGVLSYTVEQRIPEIGLRMALGAQRNDVILSVIRPAMWVVCSGLALGLVFAYAAMGIIATMLFNVSPTDPRTFAGVAILLLGVSLAASYVPARRAAAVDPLVALKRD